MFERFTERARQVVVLAQEEARYYGHENIGTDHILLGLLREEEGLASRALENLGLREDNFPRSNLQNYAGQSTTTGQLPFSPRAKKVLEGSLREALSLSNSYIGTEHILLALSSTDGFAHDTLNSMDITPVDIRHEVLRMLRGPEWERHKSEEENSKSDGQKDSEQDFKRVRVTITSGDSTLTYEGKPSSLVSQLIKTVLESGSKI